MALRVTVCAPMSTLVAPTVAKDEWLWGWDDTPGIVSVWATADGRAWCWRRRPESGELFCERARFRPWLLLASLEDLERADALPRRGPAPRDDATLSVRELAGPGELRYLVSARDGQALVAAVLRGASLRLGRAIHSLRELGEDATLQLPPEEQYLVASGRTHFRGLAYQQVRRAQLDLETTDLSPARGRIFLIAARSPEGQVELLEAEGEGDSAESALLRQLVAWVRRVDPDVIENHNLHGFDLPFLAHRAEALGVPLWLGRAGGPGLRRRPAARGARLPAEGEPASEERGEAARKSRYTVAGRELLDSLDFVRRHDFAARDLPGHGLKAVARHLGLTAPERELVPGRAVHEIYRREPERVRRYAAADVEEAAGVARVLGGATFALAQMVPRRYERLADAGAATGVLDPLLVRAYLRAGAALPAHQPGDGTAHHGAALHLFATGVAERVVKADVASLYPSLMRQHRIGPARDRLGVLLHLVDRLVELRLAAKARAKSALDSAARHSDEAMSAAMKLVVNSAYGYLAAGALTRFSDVHAANRVTREGRAVLQLLCRELAARGVTLLEADTDGVYFAVPPSWVAADEQRVVAEVAALLPPLVQLQLDGRYAAMLSHEPKNYALLPYDGPLILRGVAFRSSRSEPFGEEFLRHAIERLLRRDLLGVQRAYLATVHALRRRELPVEQVAARVRLSKTPEEYELTRAQRRELPYEAMLQSGRLRWQRNTIVHVVRLTHGRAAVLDEPREAEDEAGSEAAPRQLEYDTDYYTRLLRTTFAARLETGLSAEQIATIFADPDQLSLFAASLEGQEPRLTMLSTPSLDEPA